MVLSEWVNNPLKAVIPVCLCRFSKSHFITMQLHVHKYVKKHLFLILL